MYPVPECLWQPNLADDDLPYGLLPIKSHDPLITCPCEIGCSLKSGGSARKRLGRHRRLVFQYLHKQQHRILLGKSFQSSLQRLPRLK